MADNISVFCFCSFFVVSFLIKTKSKPIFPSVRRDPFNSFSIDCRLSPILIPPTLSQPWTTVHSGSCAPVPSMAPQTPTPALPFPPPPQPQPRYWKSTKSTWNGLSNTSMVSTVTPSVKQLTRFSSPLVVHRRGSEDGTLRCHLRMITMGMLWMEEGMNRTGQVQQTGGWMGW